MAYENVVALTVTDEDLYRRYREAMMPILAAHGGSFRYDFQVAKVLKTESDAEINRVFVIAFEDRASKEAFFANPEYLAVRAKYFVPAVKTTTIVAEYERP